MVLAYEDLMIALSTDHLFCCLALSMFLPGGLFEQAVAGKNSNTTSPRD